MDGERRRPKRTSGGTSAVAAPELALVQALLEAATALPGFVQHDTADHNRLLQSLFGDRPDGGTLPTPERHPDAFAPG